MAMMCLVVMAEIKIIALNNKKTVSVFKGLQENNTNNYVRICSNLQQFIN